MRPNLNFTIILGLSATAVSCSNPQAGNIERPNIIYIMSDDHAYQAISAFGGMLKDLEKVGLGKPILVK